jgi:hypothetical protein
MDQDIGNSYVLHCAVPYNDHLFLSCILFVETTWIVSSIVSGSSCDGPSVMHPSFKSCALVLLASHVYTIAVVHFGRTS